VRIWFRIRWVYDDPDSLAAGHRTQVFVCSRNDSYLSIAPIEHRATAQDDRRPAVLESLGQVTVIVLWWISICLIRVGDLGVRVRGPLAGAGRVMSGVYRGAVSETVVVVRVEELSEVTSQVTRLATEPARVGKQFEWLCYAFDQPIYIYIYIYIYVFSW